MRSLLDVNVLVALLDADHSQHARAARWLGGHAAQGWASCPITQNGCVRTMSHPGYPNPLPAAAVKTLGRSENIFTGVVTFTSTSALPA